jgi:hypothetical protein
MTSNQIAYWKVQEEARANRAKEDISRYAALPVMYKYLEGGPEAISSAESLATRLINELFRLPGSSLNNISNHIGDNVAKSIDDLLQSGAGSKVSEAVKNATTDNPHGFENPGFADAGKPISSWWDRLWDSLGNYGRSKFIIQ